MGVILQKADYCLWTNYRKCYKKKEKKKIEIMTSLKMFKEQTTDDDDVIPWNIYDYD